MIDIAVIILLTIILSSEKRPQSKSFKNSVLLGYLLFNIINESLQLLNSLDKNNTQERAFCLVRILIFSRNHAYVALACCYIDIKLCNYSLSSYFDFKLIIAYIYSAITFSDINITGKLLLLGFLFYLAFQYDSYFLQFRLNPCFFFLITSALLVIKDYFGFYYLAVYFYYYILYPFFTIAILFQFQFYSYDQAYMLAYIGNDKNLVNCLFDSKLRSRSNPSYGRMDYYLSSFISFLAVYVIYKYVFVMSSYIEMNLILILSYPLAGSLCNSTKADSYHNYVQNVYSIIFGLLFYGIVFDLISFSV